jgi:hypothetical protein
MGTCTAFLLVLYLFNLKISFGDLFDAYPNEDSSEDSNFNFDFGEKMTSHLNNHYHARESIWAPEDITKHIPLFDVPSEDGDNDKHFSEKAEKNLLNNILDVAEEDGDHDNLEFLDLLDIS